MTTTSSPSVVHVHTPSVTYVAGCVACELCKGSLGVHSPSSLPHRYYTVLKGGVWHESVDTEQDALKDAERLSQASPDISFAVMASWDGDLVRLVACYINGIPSVEV